MAGDDRSLNFEGTKEYLSSIGINIENCKSLEDAKAISESFIDINGYSFERMIFVFTVLGIPKNKFLGVWQRWLMNYCPSLRNFASYAAYILMLDIFFYIGLVTKLLSEKVTNKLDLSYLYYLPFCKIFVSSDKFHRNCAPLFLRNDQIFVWGFDLKADLKKVDQYYEDVPEIEKEKGLLKIAMWPPPEDIFLITRLWDKFQPRWGTISQKPIKINQDKEKDIAQQVIKFTNATPIKEENIDNDYILSSVKVMVVELRQA